MASMLQCSIGAGGADREGRSGRFYAASKTDAKEQAHDEHEVDDQQEDRGDAG